MSHFQYSIVFLVLSVNTVIFALGAGNFTWSARNSTYLYPTSTISILVNGNYSDQLWFKLEFNDSLVYSSVASVLYPEPGLFSLRFTINVMNSSNPTDEFFSRSFMLENLLYSYDGKFVDPDRIAPNVTLVPMKLLPWYGKVAPQPGNASNIITVGGFDTTLHYEVAILVINLKGQNISTHCTGTVLSNTELLFSPTWFDDKKSKAPLSQIESISIPSDSPHIFTAIGVVDSYRHATFLYPGFPADESSSSEGTKPESDWWEIAFFILLALFLVFSAIGIFFIVRMRKAPNDYVQVK